MTVEHVPPRAESGEAMAMDRITFDERIMGGRACIRGMRIPVSVVLKLLAGGMTHEQVLADYPDLEAQDLAQCLMYAAMLADEMPLTKVEE
jgi:uncharacterized protein (DUF433 family)